MGEKYLFPVLICVFLCGTLRAQKFALTGKVMDSSYNMPLYGANVFFPNQGLGTSTDENGYFQINMEAGVYPITVSYAGYDAKDTLLDLRTDLEMLFELTSVQLKEVRIVAEKTIPFHRKDVYGASRLSMERATFLPSFSGYPDPVKASLYLPGVSGSRDATSHVVIRGSEYDQNILMLDGVPMPQYNHLFGLVSIINPDLVQDVRVYKTGHPISYSNLLGGVFDVQISPGSDTKSSHFTLGLLNSGYQQSGPLGKGTYNIGGRLSYFDLINLYPMLKNIRTKKNLSLKLADAIDLGIKISQPFLSGELSLTALGGFSNLGSRYRNVQEEGRLGSIDNSTYKQRNYVGMAGLKIVHKLPENWSWANRAYLTLSNPDITSIDDYTTFQTDFDSYRTIDTDIQTQHLKTFGLKSELTKLTNRNHTLLAGVNWEKNTNSFSKEFGNTLVVDETKSSQEHLYGPFDSTMDLLAIYIAYGGKNRFWKYDLGAKTIYYQKQDEIVFLPKASIAYSLNERTDLYFNYQRTTQNRHIPYGNILTNRYPVWVFKQSNEHVSRSNHWGLGYTTGFANGWEGNLEIFYQDFSHLSYYELNFDNVNYYQLRSSLGTGYNYGLEYSMSKAWRNKTNLQASYTWVKSKRRYPEVNNGISYPADYAREHEFKIQFLFPYKKLLIGTNWIFGSGFPYTIPNAKVWNEVFPDYNYISGKNNFNLPVYHRLDVSVSRSFETKKGRNSIFSFNVFNLYNRFNADHIVPDFTDKTLTKISNFGIVPSFYYKLFIK